MNLFYNVLESVLQSAWICFRLHSNLLRILLDFFFSNSAQICHRLCLNMSQNLFEYVSDPVRMYLRFFSHVFQILFESGSDSVQLWFRFWSKIIRILVQSFSDSGRIWFRFCTNLFQIVMAVSVC